jgi:hypothetical protein
LENRAERLKRSWWRCRMLNAGGAYAKSFYRKIGTLPFQIQGILTLDLPNLVDEYGLY